MGDDQLMDPPNEDDSVADFEYYSLLMKDRKPICRTRCLDPPIQMPPTWSICDIVRQNPDNSFAGLPQFTLLPASENCQQEDEWQRFLGFLQKYNKVAVAKIRSYEFYIYSPDKGPKFGHALVSCRRTHNMHDGKKHSISGITGPATMSDHTKLVSNANSMSGVLPPSTGPTKMVKEFISRTDAAKTHRGLASLADKNFQEVTEDLPACELRDGNTISGFFKSSTDAAIVAEELVSRPDVDMKHRVLVHRGSVAILDEKFPETTEDLPACESRHEACSPAETSALRQNGIFEKNYVQAHPSYLKTLGHAHSGWIFGAIAELVDNSRDAKATKLEISIDMVYSKIAGKDIPMLSVIDDGHGMTHQEIFRMLSFGHKQPDADDHDHIGRFGIGFKTGAMRLGKDVLVLTQTANSRSIAFLSQSLNEGRDNLEIPIVSYCRRGQFMEVDTRAQSEALAKHNLKAIKEFSPFNKYLIGEKASFFHEVGTGTQIYIWNLDKWGSDYCLEWQKGMNGGSSFHQGDILIRSKRIRSRPGQTSRVVPLDYSLRSYLEVIFLDPRMKLYLQGSQVRSRPLAKSLNRTVVENGIIMGKPVQLILGCSQLEWEQANCGIFLYWHGRLIEAYKRVGGMIHSADTGRGVIGVIDVTNLMNDGNGQVWVHSNKQGFQDCELYAQLEQWLGGRFDQYWDSNFDTLQLRKGCARYKPDDEWVQCDKCRKWRMLSSGYDSRQLPQEWFCYMDPFNGKCEMQEQKVERGVITVSSKRSMYGLRQSSVKFTDALVNPNGILEGSSDDDSGQTEEDDFQNYHLKRIRRGPPRLCKKA